jgi:integrase/recombinase XerD
LIRWVHLAGVNEAFVRAPLLPVAQRILEAFSINNKEGKLLPRISNQKINSYLKEIADIVGINKNLTHKAARKTYASTVLLSNGVPMEIVSKLLGHQSMVVTERHYAELSNKKVTAEIDKLKLILIKGDEESRSSR